MTEQSLIEMGLVSRLTRRSLMQKCSVEVSLTEELVSEISLTEVNVIGLSFIDVSFIEI